MDFTEILSGFRTSYDQLTSSWKTPEVFQGNDFSSSTNSSDPTEFYSSFEKTKSSLSADAFTTPSVFTRSATGSEEGATSAFQFPSTTGLSSFGGSGTAIDSDSGNFNFASILENFKSSRASQSASSFFSSSSSFEAPADFMAKSAKPSTPTAEADPHSGAFTPNAAKMESRLADLPVHHKTDLGHRNKVIDNINSLSKEGVIDSEDAKVVTGELHNRYNAGYDGLNFENMKNTKLDQLHMEERFQTISDMSTLKDDFVKSSGKDLDEGQLKKMSENLDGLVKRSSDEIMDDLLLCIDCNKDDYVAGRYSRSDTEKVDSLQGYLDTFDTTHSEVDRLDERLDPKRERLTQLEEYLGEEDTTVIALRKDLDALQTNLDNWAFGEGESVDKAFLKDNKAALVDFSTALNDAEAAADVRRAEEAALAEAEALEAPVKPSTEATETVDDVVAPPMSKVAPDADITEGPDAGVGPGVKGVEVTEVVEEQPVELKEPATFMERMAPNLAILEETTDDFISLAMSLARDVKYF